MNISLWARTALSLQKRRIYQNSLKGFQSRRFLSTGHDVFLQGNSGNYVGEMYQSWKTDPSSVHVSWQQYFKQLDAGVPSNKAFYAPPNLISGADIAPREAAEPYSMEESAGAISDHLKVQLLIRSYQVRGHRLANLDPLSLNNTEKSFKKELDYRKYGFVESDLDKTFQLGPGMLPGFLSRGYTSMTLREIVKNLEDIYCSSIGVEYTHIPDRDQCSWLRERLEVPNRIQYSIQEKKRILDRLVWSTSFESFIKTKWPSAKRFGLEGCESLIPGMKAMIDTAVDLDVKSIIIGMAHRGRLNVLSNVIRKPNESIFCEFSGNMAPAKEGSGDVKYHLGANFDRPTPSGRQVHLSLVANPSHLEAANGVVLGKTRATQFYSNDTSRTESMAVLLHGDAAFAAQGIVYETMGFADLPYYTTGGTVHIVINNQIGFTTDPRVARSTPYCTDVAKAIHAPIFHVNGDDVEAVNWVCQIAAEWRQKYKKDVVVDIVCYRKYGHNEIDQPMYTNPLMYKKIQNMKPSLDHYTQKLMEDGFSKEDIEQNKLDVLEKLEKCFIASKSYVPDDREWVSSPWMGVKSPKELAEQITPVHPTGVDLDLLQKVGEKTSTIPQGFKAHPNLVKIMQKRLESVKTGEGVDWATAEALAVGTLLLDGKHVRISGQDVERGTFSQRHAVLHDQETGEAYVALNNLGENQTKFTVCNSSLSEFGTSGFELGYSLVNPWSLVIWEAQFGDFANNAQCIIDQFIASGEKKWLQRTGLVLNLPHGYDGQGPEHSSARVERFLQLCDDHPYRFPDPVKLQRQHQECNIQVVYPSTPANYFHALRRQVYRDFRKPLILIFSKSLLRLEAAKSNLADMAKGTSILRYIPEPHPENLVSANKIRKHILCTGQVYYLLLKERNERGITDVAISRLEQISPFPYDLLREHLDVYPNAETVWVQEEPLNMGAWFYVNSRIKSTLEHTEQHRGKEVGYVAREPTAAVATGRYKTHLAEEQRIVEDALLS